jgi:hypothetical protein
MDPLASIVSLAVLTSFACLVLLFRAYAATGIKLLLWSGLCFVFLTVSNVFLFFDLLIFVTEVDLRLYRVGSALVGVLFLIYAFIWEVE